MQQEPLVGDRHEVALVGRGPLPKVRQVADHIHAAHEARRIGEVVHERHADARHANHVQHHHAIVGELHTGGEGLERRSRWRHEIRNDVGGLVRRGAAHQLHDNRLHLGGEAPVVVRALVVWVTRCNEGTLLGARGVLYIGARVVATAAHWADLAGGERLGDEAIFITSVDHLNARGGCEARPLAHEVAHVGIGKAGRLACGIGERVGGET